MRKWISLLFAAVLAWNLAVPALAAGNVSYEGRAEGFLFRPGSLFSPTDLFPDFKDVMPGDTLTEEIEIRNDARRGVKIRLWLRSHGAQEGTGEFLSQLQLTVKQRGDSILFDAPADEPGDLSQWTYLGTIYSGGRIRLDLTLEVPKEMGNEFAGNIGYIDWEFMIQELPVAETDPEIPKTYDPVPIALLVGIMSASAAALLALGTDRRRKPR